MFVDSFKGIKFGFYFRHIICPRESGACYVSYVSHTCANLFFFTGAIGGFGPHWAVHSTSA